jgi:hypothetical protein
MRRRAERFAGQMRYRALPDPLYDKATSGKPSELKFQLPISTSIRRATLASARRERSSTQAAARAR